MRSWRVWLGFLISIFFVYLALRGQDFGLIWESIRSAEYIWLVPAIAVYFLGVAVRAVRWDYLLRGVSKLSPAQLFPIVTIGYMANNVLPLRAGELVRAYALSTRHQVRKSASLATIGVERIFDGITMLVFFAVASLSIALTSDLRTVFNLAVALFALMAAGMIAFVFLPVLRDKLIAAVIDRLPDRIGERVGPMAQAFVDGLSILRRRNDLLGVGLASVLAWLLEATMYLMIAQAFDMDISPFGILMITAVANLATLIPSSPGYVGAFEYGVLLVVAGPLGFERELAISYAVVVHAALYLPVTLVGFAFWWRESFSWGAVREAEKAAS